MKTSHFAILLFAASSVAYSKPNGTLKCNWGKYNPPPYIILKNDVPHSGIIYDICKKYSDSLGLEPKLIKTPRKRAVELCKNGATDIIITANKNWLPALESAAKWLPSIFVAGKSLVFHKENKHLSSLPINKLENLKIGALFGNNYYNQALNKKFANKTLIRVDTKDEVAGLKLLKSRRVDATIVERISAEYKKQQDPKFYKDFVFSSNNFTFSNITPVICPKSKVNHSDLENTTKSLIKAGFFKSIISKYK